MAIARPLGALLTQVIDTHGGVARWSEHTLRHVIEAHGGVENWNKHEALSVDLVIGGMLWGLKGQAGKLVRAAGWPNPNESKHLAK